MEQYTTTCGTKLPLVDGAKNYNLVFYKVTEYWEEFLRMKNPYDEMNLADDDFRKKIAQAACTMYTTNGIGIAANQVGFKENWCIIDTAWRNTGEKKPRVIINPNIDESLLIETEKESYEGCLSVPMGFRGTVPRHSAVHLVYTNLKGETETWDAVDLDAAAVMHELDHLLGKIIIEYISKLRLSFLENKLKKVKKAVQYKIKSHNKQIIDQVKRLNTAASWGYRPKEADDLERLEKIRQELKAEAAEHIEVVVDEQVHDITG